MDYKEFAQLADVLASLLPTVDDAKPYLKKAGISLSYFTHSQKPLNLWTNILEYAEANDADVALVHAVLENFKKNPYLLSFLKDRPQHYDLGPDIKSLSWKDDDSKTQEKIIEEVSTLLPISFLSVGVNKAKSVCRVLIPVDNSDEVGSGFLLKNNFLMTNNHVIPDAQAALKTKVEFNYEIGTSGRPIKSVEFKLLPSKGFETNKTLDWTIVKVAGNANKLFGHLPMSISSKTKKDDFVNIIQHPGGGFKQIGLYHNVVTFSNQEIVQYLTDTEPGSSGSPVFNSNWDVVALHHSGGWLKEPNSTRRSMRNEGIAIPAILKSIRKKEILKMISK